MSTITDPVTPSALNLAELYEMIESLRRGEFEKRLNADGLSGRAGMIARTLNATMEMLQNFKTEHLRLMNEIGTQGMLGGTMEVFNATGGWLDMIDAVNAMSATLTVELRRACDTVGKMSRGEPREPRTGQQRVGGEIAKLNERLEAFPRS